MELRISVPELGQVWEVEWYAAAKDARNRSFAQASGCCGVKLNQHKVCSKCGEKQPYKTGKKIVKVGKDEVVVDARVLEDALSKLGEKGTMVVKKLLREVPVEAENRVESVVFLKPKEKGEIEYAECREALRGFVGVAEGVFRNNGYECVVDIVDDMIRVRRLVEQSQYNGEPEIEPCVVDTELLAMRRELLEGAVAEEHDFSQYRDSRVAAEEAVIEAVALGKPLPQFGEEVVVQKAENERERLKALLAAKKAGVER